MKFHKVVLTTKKNLILGYFVNSESVMKGPFMLGRRKQKNCIDFENALGQKEEFFLMGVCPYS